MVVGQEALVEHDGAILLIREVGVERQQHLVALRLELPPSRGIAQWRVLLPAEPAQALLVSRDLVGEGLGWN